VYCTRVSHVSEGPKRVLGSLFFFFFFFFGTTACVCGIRFDDYCHHYFQDRDQCRAFVNTLMNLTVPCNTGNSLTTLGTVTLKNGFIYTQLDCFLLGCDTCVLVCVCGSIWILVSPSSGLRNILTAKLHGVVSMTAISIAGSRNSCLNVQESKAFISLLIYNIRYHIARYK